MARDGMARGRGPRDPAVPRSALDRGVALRGPRDRRGPRAPARAGGRAPRPQAEQRLARRRARDRGVREAPGLRDRSAARRARAAPSDARGNHDRDARVSLSRAGPRRARHRLDRGRVRARVRALRVHRGPLGVRGQSPHRPRREGPARDGAATVLDRARLGSARRARRADVDPREGAAALRCRRGRRPPPRPAQRERAPRDGEGLAAAPVPRAAVAVPASGACSRRVDGGRDGDRRSLRGARHPPRRRGARGAARAPCGRLAGPALGGGSTAPSSSRPAPRAPRW
jgi:hypothetical protein